MDVSGDHLFPAAGFSRHQNRGLRWPSAIDRFPDLLHLLALAYERAKQTRIPPRFPRLLVRVVVSVNLGPSAREELGQVNELRRRGQDAKNGALHGVRERIGFARKITEDSKRRSGKADLDLLHGGF